MVRATLAVTVAVALALVVTGGSVSLGDARANKPLLDSGAPNFLATTNGVVWSFSQGVLRSTDRGETWRTVFPPNTSANEIGPAASYFLGPEDGWIVNVGAGVDTTVYRTSDGGEHWFQSAELEGVPSAGTSVLFYQLFFSDAEYGWLLGVGTVFLPSVADSLTESLWRTSDGGRTWSETSNELPLQGLALASYGSTACPTFSPTHIAFANADVGWFTEGDCEHGSAHPLVWTTHDGGLQWTASSLPAPAGGWRQWDVLDHGGTDVGSPYVVGPAASPIIVVPVSLGISRLVVERSTDMGRSWQIAGSVDTRALPLQSTPADWFDPINALDWVLAAPGGLIETTSAGRTWSFVRSPYSPSGQPASFTSPAYGLVQGTGNVVAVRTQNGGRTWTAESVPPSGYEPSAVSTVAIAGPHLAFAAGAAGLLASANGGRTWVARLAAASSVGQLDIVNSQVGFSLANTALIRTTDGGVSWQGLLHPVAGGVAGFDFWSASAGVVSVGYQRLYLTSDAGTTWQPLRLPRGWTIANATVGGNQPADICLGANGVAWVVANRGNRYGVLVSANSGRSWRVALSPDLLPLSVYAREPAGAGIAACKGDAAWVLVTQPAGPMDMQGIPTTFDLLRSLNLGRSWLDALRSPSEVKVARPKLPSLRGGPLAVPFLPGPFDLTLASPTAAWFTSPNENFGAITFASTGDGGLRWSIHSFQEPQGSQRSPWPFPLDGTWLTTASVDAVHAWVLFSAAKGDGDSYLYETSDGGSAWKRLTVFR